VKGRFFVDPDPTDAGLARLDAAAARHVRALRLARGDRVCAIVAPGRERAATIARIERDLVLLDLGEDLPAPTRDPRAPRTLVIALGDPARMETVVEKATELGVTAIQPFVAARSQARSLGDARRDRWQRIARAACEQCGRTVEPEVLPCIDIDGVAVLIGAAPAVWVLSPRSGDAVPPRAASAPATGAPAGLVLVIGPEGGLRDDEIALLVARGARPVTLGPRVLRFETAAIAALALALDRFPD